MKAPLYQEILTLCQTMADSSGKGDENAREQAHKSLQKLCQTNLGTPNDHPLQWEALADFTDDGDQALDIYQLALNCAEKMQLMNHKASILLAMAQRHVEFDEADKAKQFLEQITPILAKITDEELKSDINAMTLQLSKQP